MTEPVFVFGSNLAGRHGAGAALFAREHHGAIYGQGVGLQGNSWAIPVKDGRGGADLKDPAQTLPLSEIALYVVAFLAQAKVLYPHLTFQVTPIGCGLAGFTPEQIAPFFRDAPANVILPDVFLKVLNGGAA